MTYSDAPQFDSLKVEEFEPRFKALVADTRRRIDALLDDTAEPGWDNFVLPYIHSGDELDALANVFYPLTSAVCTDEIQEALERIAPLLSDHSTAIMLDERLWARLKRADELIDRATLSPEENRLFDQILLGFRRNGADLQGQARDRYRDIVRRLTELGTLYGRNVREATAACSISVTADQAAGIDPRHLGEPDGDGVHTVRLSQPVYMELMRTAVDRDTRRRAYMAWSTRCTAGANDNRPVLCETAVLRAEKAALLGYPDHAAYSLEQKMAHNATGVYGLLNRLRDAYRPLAEAELKEMRAAACVDRLEPWDYAYWYQWLRDIKFSASADALKPYFEAGRTLEAVLGLADTLYGVTFVGRNDIPVYHPDVRVFEATDRADGASLGLLYVDLWARPTKQPGAWMTDFRPQDEGQRPLISIVTNFTAPAGGAPALLTPGEVSTLLHEFGHALHGLFSRVRFSELGGTNVRRDFVELPSQLNEYFLLQPEWLATFARHYKTGEPLDAEQIANLDRADRYGAGYAGLRQLGFGYLDMAWHTLKRENVPSPDEVEAFETRAMQGVATLPHTPGTMTSATFGHIFNGGYAAGYYSYKWAEVLAADAFGAFEEAGAVTPLNAAATAFRREVLSRGDTADPDVLYRRFRKREPSVEALLRREGAL